ncbi:esterase-like activity of phytase family protein [Candidatus Poribacteria bacterium]|nr:esterase-like activity of phytase family protein [Candidatus Poribacteria bacterium]MYB64831.1 esterase-like activity of phytase family protein [Candidatus Poribacteria bacterium]
MKWTHYLLIFILIATIGFAEEHVNFGTPPWQPLGQYTHNAIRESSGIVASRQFEGVYWTLNDSGNPSTLYATQRNGTLIKEIEIRGTRNFDWEALAIDKKGQLWIGDIGNNSRMRIDLNVVVVKEPDPYTETEAHVIAKYPYKYPEQNVDAEGLFIADGIPYIVTKEQSSAVLFRFPTMKAGSKQILERVGEFTDARLVTGAGVSPDGKRLAVCTYNALWVYHADDGNISGMIQSKPWILQHNFQGEAICFEDYNLYLTNEARDIYSLPQFWYEKQLQLPPKDTQSAISLLTHERTEGVTIENYRDAGIDIDGGHVALNAKVSGGSVHQVMDVPYRNLYRISAVLTRGPEYGHVELTLNGMKVGDAFDCYHSEHVAGTLVKFGAVPLNQGKNQITLKSTGKSAPSTGYKVGVDSYQVLHASPFVKRYMILGPFSKADGNEAPPTASTQNPLNLDQTYTGAEGKTIRWREASTRPSGMLDFRANIGMMTGVVGYAVSYVYTPEDMDTVLLLGSDETVKVWLNGTEIHSKRTYRRITPDADRIPCQLKAGWNEVLCSVEQNSWTWALYLRFTDADGVLKYSTIRDSD